MGIYYNFLDSLLKGEYDLASDTLKMALLTPSYAPDYASDTQYSDIASYEPADSGYTAGGSELSGVSFSATTPYYLDAGDIGWNNFSSEVRYAALYDDTHANKELIALYDLGGDVTPSGDAFILTFATNGFLTIPSMTKWYDKYLYQLCRGNANLNTATLKVALVTDSYTPDQVNDATYSDISSYESQGTGYTAGGATIDNNAVVLSTNTARLDGDNICWTDLNLTASYEARYAVVYDTTYGDRLVMYHDFGTDKDGNGACFLLSPAASGIAYITC